MNAKRLARFIKSRYPKSAVLAASQASSDTRPDLRTYRNNPVGFCTDILGVKLTPQQVGIATASAHGGRVKTNAGHNVGKTKLTACLALWWFHSRDPAVVVTTGPTKHHVETVLWTEIRLTQMQARVPLPNYLNPRAARMYHHPDHWAEGVTAATGEGFQGKHRPSMFFAFDECEDVDTIYWLVTDTMYKPGADHLWVAIGNPETTASQSAVEDDAVGPDGKPKWRLFSLSALDHPNVVEELAGRPPPVPNAVSLSQVEQWVSAWTTRIHPDDRRAGDVEWPPASGQWRRPGPRFKARALGVRPTEGVDTVWGAAAFAEACRPKWNPRDCWYGKHGVTIGCDPAAFGDDDSAFHVRSGPLSVHHEARNGLGPKEVAKRLKELCSDWAGWYNALAEDPRTPLLPEDVTAVIELDGGLGHGVFSHRGGFRGWRGVTVGGKSDVLGPDHHALYANVRAELWTEAASLAAAGAMDLSRLSPDTLTRLRAQLLTVYYKPLPSGVRQVEPKADIKARSGRSPDDAEALIISHARTATYSPSVIGPDPDAAPSPADRHDLFGRKLSRETGNDDPWGLNR